MRITGQNPGWIDPAPAEIPRAVSAQKGQTKRAIRHTYTLSAFRTLNLIQVKTHASGQGWGQPKAHFSRRPSLLSVAVRRTSFLGLPLRHIAR